MKCRNLNTKKEIYGEITKMKSEMENYLQTMDKLYGEIESRDETIKQFDTWHARISGCIIFQVKARASLSGSLEDALY